MEPHAEYVAARRALLDALELLAPHRQSLILIGAQAVYLHAPEGLATPAYTTDADLAISPDLLGTEPEISALLAGGGFTRSGDPGGWQSPGGIHLDLMVPDAVVTTRSRRSAALPGHQPQSARRVKGIELALVDHTPHVIGAFEPSDTRTFTLKVASPAALVIAKTVKLRERLEANDRSRVLAKDAGDLLRLLRMCDAVAMGARLRALAMTTAYGELVISELEWLGAETSQRNSRVVVLAVEAALGSERDGVIEASMRALVRQLTAG